MANEYVRVCPVCDRDNAPERARCACGASLLGIDFSLKRASVAAPDPPPAAEPAPDPPPVPVAAAVAPGDTADAADAAPAQATIVCPHPDCGQPNPPGRERCVYCNRPLDATAPVVAGARPLPAALRDDYRVVDVFPATGSEADILLVARVRDGERCVAKLYRRGVAPDFRLLDILAGSVGDTVVRVLAHGVSDGTAYELLEYVGGGTLEALMSAGPLPKSDIRRIVQEIADALNGIHAHRILHRDLKPENVLIRSKSPLELALTDFGIASLASATQHFTSVARTTRYAAPEVLTGVLDAKADWWSLGMIVLEAASGRHPFDGLSEQVMNHHLATRPIDVRGVYDDELRQLCRGLLLRDPKKRWGGDEVARWLAGDATLVAPGDADGTSSAVRPYRFGKTEATTGAELALALARHWDDARRDLKRGQVGKWLEDELHDYNLVRVLRDIGEQRGLSDDARLVRFLLAAAPELPPVWRGQPVTANALAAAARAAAQDGGDAQEWLDSLFRDEVLAIYARAGHAQLAPIDAAWRADVTQFLAIWESARRAEATWRSQSTEIRGNDGTRASSYDDVVYVAVGALAAPDPRTLHGPLLLARADPAYVDALRAEVTAGLGPVAGYCPWFDAIWERAQRDAVGVVVARLMLPFAQDDATHARRRQSATAEQQAHESAAVREELRARLQDLLALVPSGDEDLERDTVSQLLGIFGEFQIACQRVLRLSHVDAEHDALRRATEKLSSLALAAQRALARAEEVRGINAIFVTPARMAGAFFVLVIALALRVPAFFLVVVGVAVLAVAYRWYVGFRATEAAIERLKHFGLHARTFLRNEPDPDAGKAAAR